MVSKTAKVLGGLALLGVAGLALAATAEPEPEAPAAEFEVAGLSISEDCATVTVLDSDALLIAFDEHFEASGAEQWFDPAEPSHLEQLLLDFLVGVAPQCYPPVADNFAWVTTVPEMYTRTWQDVVADMQEAMAIAQAGFEAAGEEEGTYDLEAAAYALATGELPEVAPKIPTPDMVPPLAPEAAAEPAAAAAGDVMPENVVYATDEDHLRQTGIDLAMESAGALSPERSAVFLVYDPEYPQLDDLIGAVYDFAREEPDVLFVLASSWDTQRELGVPEKLGVFGFAYNAANDAGQWLYAEGTQANRDAAPPPEQRWNQLVDHAAGPEFAEPPVAMI